MELAQRYWARLQRIHEASPDLSFTLLASLFVLLGVLTIPQEVSVGTTFREFDGLATALIVLQTSSIAFLRRWPVLIVAVVFGSMVASAAIGYDITSISALVALLVVFYFSYTRPLNQSAPFVAVFISVIALLFFLTGRHSRAQAEDILFTSGIFFAVSLVAIFLQTRKAKFSEAERLTAELTELNAKAAEEGAAEERLRIARELHDAIGHTLNLIVVQAGAAQRVRETNPEASYDALSAIEGAGRQALNDMDRMLGILREPTLEERGSDSLGPRPGLDRLGTLLDEARRAGIEIDLDIEGEQRRLPASIDLTAYRVVQEGITNVMKHAPGARTKILLKYDSRAVRLEIRNERSSQTPTSNSDGGGRGLAGMRERVSLFGGSMSSAATKDGGYVIKVSIPLNGTD